VLHAEEDAAQVDVEETVPLVVGDLHERLRQLLDARHC
jgi:hypothetical protein